MDLTNGECLYSGSKLRLPRHAKTNSEQILRQDVIKRSKAVIRSHSGAIPKPKPCSRVEKGQIVLLKMRGYTEWPAIVTGFEKNLIVAKFFGNDEWNEHKAAIKIFYDFGQSADFILRNLQIKKAPLFTKAVKEAEYALGIPDEKSIFKRI